MPSISRNCFTAANDCNDSADNGLSCNISQEFAVFPLGKMLDKPLLFCYDGEGEENVEKNYAFGVLSINGTNHSYRLYNTNKNNQANTSRNCFN